MGQSKFPVTVGNFWLKILIQLRIGSYASGTISVYISRAKNKIWILEKLGDKLATISIKSTFISKQFFFSYYISGGHMCIPENQAITWSPNNWTASFQYISYTSNCFTKLKKKVKAKWVGRQNTQINSI